MLSTIFPLADLLTAAVVPGDLRDKLTALIADLPQPGFRDLTLHAVAGGLELHTILVPPPDLALEPFGPGGFGISLSDEGVPLAASLSSSSARLRLEPTIVLRIPPEILRPAAGSAQTRVEISCPLRFDIAWEDSQPFSFFALAPGGLSLSPAEIGTTGFTLAIDDFQLSLVPDDPLPAVLEAGFGEGFVGLYVQRAVIALPPWLALQLPQMIVQDAAIGTQGFTGRVQLQLNPTVVPASAGQPQRFQGEGSGTILGFAAAIESLAIDIRANRFTGSSLAGKILLPFIDSPLSFQAALNPAGSGISFDLSQTSGLSLSAPGASLSADAFSGSAAISEAEGLRVSGTLNGNVRVSLGNLLNLALGSASFTLTSSANVSRFEAAVTEADFGPLGTLSNARFAIEQAADGSRTASIGAEMVWRDLASRLAIPAELPAPQPNARVAVLIEARTDAAGRTVLVLRCTAEAAQLDTSFLNGLPASARPEFRNAALVFEAVFDNEAALRNAPRNGPLQGTFSASIEMRFPTLPALFPPDFLRIDSGDPEGWVRAQLSANLGGGSAALTLALEDVLSITMNLPVMPQAQPPLALTVTRISFDLAFAAGGSSRGKIDFAASFRLSPLAPPPALPFAPDLTRLLRGLQLSPLDGSAALSLQFEGSRSALLFDATFADAAVSLDLFEFLGSLTRGLPLAADATAPGKAGDLSLEVGFALKGLKLQLGALDPNAPQALFQVDLLARFGPAEADGFVRLSDRELAIGVGGAEVPLRLPRFPVAPSDLQALAGAGGGWTRARFDLALARLAADIAAAAARTGRSAAAQRGELTAKQGMLRFIRDVWSSLSSGQPRRTYQDGVVTLVTILDGVSGIAHQNSSVRLVVGSASVRLPFDDPRSVAVEGAATLTGFDPDDPLHGLEGLTLRLGLSPEQIYFGLEASGEPIPLPPVGRYVNGRVSVSQLTIGYGFTKNSLAVTFAGELVYPEHLTEDVDTSRAIGFGIKLPRYNRLAFQLDMIPVPGPIPVVPACQFALDLRTPGLPALANTQVCAPVFDGLELRVPGVIHADIKALSASPLFGVIPAINVRFDGNLDVGNEQFGLTIVCDDLLWLAGIGTPPNSVPVTLLIDPAAPYFEHLCVNARCAGFGINFDIERPFPLPNPLIVFEALALIADPLAPIDPDGPLARSIRIALRDAYISIPRWAQRLIPGGAEIVRNEINVELNVGTLTAAVQWLARTLPPVLTRAQDAFAAGAAAVQDLAANPPRIDPGELLQLLPPELRAVDCELSFAGFAASATLILITPDDARRRAAAVNDLWQLPALSGFSRRDLGELPALRPGAAAVLATAHIELLNVANYRFFGRLGDDGSFALLTAVDVEPLELRINGLSIALPIRFNGRLLLVGEITERRRFAEIRARGSGSWDIVPGVLRVAAGVRKPVELRLSSTGRFALSGDGEVDFFNGAFTIAGALDASESHLAVSGELNFRLGGTARRPIIALSADGATQIGPGPRWSFDGRGELRLFDLTLADATLRLNERELAVHAEITRRRWRIGGLQFDTHVSGELDGQLSFPRRGSPGLRLSGRGKIEALGASLTGSIAVRADQRSLQVSAEGELTWFNKPWFGARIALASDGSAEFAGRTSVALDLTPKELPAGIQIASLFLRADFAARFSFNRRGRPGRNDIDIDWSLGLRLPGGAPGQTFVLAMQKMHLGTDGPVNAELINVQGINFVPFSDVVLPIPVITTSGNEQFIRARINIPVIDQVGFLMTDGIKDFLEDQFGERFVFGRKKLFKVPKDLKVTIEQHSLGELSASLGFRVRLRWQDDRLGFEIRRGGDRRFVGLDELL
jgi:hypothetical protein